MKCSHFYSPLRRIVVYVNLQKQKVTNLHEFQAVFKEVSDFFQRKLSSLKLLQHNPHVACMHSVCQSRFPSKMSPNMSLSTEFLNLK